MRTALRIEALAELAARPRWVASRAKVPFDVRTGRPAKVNDPDTWTTYDEALAAVRGGQYDAIAFAVTTEDPYVGGDLDHCRDVLIGALTAEAEEIIRYINTYTEVSPSGRGLRFFARGTLPAAGRKRGNVELYDEGRFLSVTGHHLEGTPRTIENRPAELLALHRRIFGNRETATAPDRAPHPVSCADWELLDRARMALGTGDRFRRVYDEGAWAADFASQSEADFWLLLRLGFWAGRDPERMDRLFRASGLMRPKWDRPLGCGTYGSYSIEQAISCCREVYQSW